ncbi:MAG: hypothetical protein ABI832_01925 [bacterium]
MRCVNPAWGKGNDTIDLHLFVAGGSLVDAAPFSSTGMAKARFNTNKGVVAGNADGDGSADWQILLANKPTIHASDLLF